MSKVRGLVFGRVAATGAVAMLVVAAALSLSFACFRPAVAAVGDEAGSPTGSFIVEGGTYGVDYTYGPTDDGSAANQFVSILTVHTDTPLVISMEDGTTTTREGIAVDSPAGATITLRDVHIDLSATGQPGGTNPTFGIAAFDIKAGQSVGVDVILEGENVLRSGAVCAGLQTGSRRYTNTTIEAVPVTVSGSGTLETQGGYWAPGIGPGYSVGASSITVSGGTVKATGGAGAAGIGAAAYGWARNITISGGEVTAIGGEADADGAAAAGIGSSSQHEASGILICGGTVNAVGGPGAAGIGSGRVPIMWTNAIVISGGTITASATEGGAAIGGGCQGGVSGIVVVGGCLQLTVEGGGSLIGAGAGGSSTYAPVIAGGLFAEGSVADNVVYGYTPLRGHSVADSSDESYPFAVVGPCQASANTSTSAQQYGETLIELASSRLKANH